MLNPYNVCLTDNTTYIVITTKKITYNWDNAVGINQIPTLKAEKGTTTPEDKTYLINLVKLKKMITIRGSLIQGILEYASGSNETNTTAKNKRLGLEAFLEDGATLNLIVNGVTHKGVVTKLEISEEPRDSETVPLDDVEIYDVMFSFIVGNDKLG